MQIREDNAQFIAIERQLDRHENLLADMKQVLINQAQMTEKLINLSEKQDGYEESTSAKLMAIEKRLEETRVIVIRWSGAIVAIMATVTMAISLAKTIL